MAERIRLVVPMLLLLAACGIYRATLASSTPDALRSLESDPAILRRAPNLIAPRYDDPRVASDAQLRGVLDRMKPTLDPLDTNVLVHALRLWGPEADFGDSRHPSGPTMLRYFLDDGEFQRLAGAATPPLFSRDADGIRVRPWSETSPHRQTGSVHADDLLATLGESGVPLSTPMILRDTQAKVADLLEGSMRRYHRRQHEYEWTAISFARYLFPANRWENRYGQPLDVDALVDELIKQPMPNGVCGGTHRLEALVVLYRADEDLHALSRRTRKKILNYLQHMSALLVQSQHVDGYWSRDWYLGRSVSTASIDSTKKKDSVYERILTTGHHLEWLALAPPEVQPPRETIVRAGQWLVREMLSEDEKTLTLHYGPLSHAARALCLWRSKRPYEAWRGPMGATPVRPEKGR